MMIKALTESLDPLMGYSDFYRPIIAGLSSEIHEGIAG